MFEILKPNRYITVVKIPLLDILNIDVLQSIQPREFMSDAISRLNIKPNFIINGGLFSMLDGRTLSTVQVEGKVITKNLCSNFGMYVDKTGEIGFELFKENTYRDFIGGSPSLVINSSVNMDIKGLDSGFILNKHPRSALGMSKTHFFLVTIDGRRIGRRGMDCKQLADFMLVLGCVNAINLDGGGSTRLGQIINNKLAILNNSTKSRAVANFICVYLKKVPIKEEIKGYRVGSFTENRYLLLKSKIGSIFRKLKVKISRN